MTEGVKIVWRRGAGEMGGGTAISTVVQCWIKGGAGAPARVDSEVDITRLQCLLPQLHRGGLVHLRVRMSLYRMRTGFIHAYS